MNEKELFILSDQLLNDVIQQIRDDQWDMEMPKEFFTRSDRTQTLRKIIDYHAYDEAWVPAMLEGKSMDEVGKDKYGKRDGSELLREHPRANYAALSEKAIAATKNLPDSELDSRTVHFSYGNYPAREALRHITAFRGFRIYDLSKVLGLGSKMPEKLVSGLWEMLRPRIAEYRQYGIFPEEVPVSEDAPLQDRLLGMIGRKP